MTPDCVMQLAYRFATKPVLTLACMFLSVALAILIAIQFIIIVALWLTLRQHCFLCLMLSAAGSIGLFVGILYCVDMLTWTWRES
jgi:hypothetical protein